MIKPWKYAAIFLVFGLAGCQSPTYNFSVPEIENSSQKIDAQLRAITVTMDRSENKPDLPRRYEGIAAYWKDALQESVDRMGLFNDHASTPVNIQVKILDVNFPLVGLTFTTKTMARYELVDRRSGAVIYRQDVEAEGVVPTSYAFLGRTRAIESINRSAQNNIKQFLHALQTEAITLPVTAVQP